MDKKNRQVICPYCKKPAVLVGGDAIYPKRADLFALKFWLCRGCDAYAGTHLNSPDHAPKGRLANAELRAARIRAHRAFDPLWKSGEMTRNQAYAWLRESLGMDRAPHIGFISLDDCRRVIQVCNQAGLGQ